MTPLFQRITTLSIPIHMATAVATVVAFVWVKGKLDASYAASNHPVDYFTGQTSFSGEKIKGYYAHMMEAGSFDIYWQTQMIDFGFIAAMGCIGLFVCTLVARLGRKNSLGYRTGLIAGMAFVVGACFDTMENLWSFVMLNNSSDFANWMALPYSSSASLKFLFITLGMLGVCISIILSIAGKLSKNPKVG